MFKSRFSLPLTLPRFPLSLLLLLEYTSNFLHIISYLVIYYTIQNNFYGETRRPSIKLYRQNKGVNPKCQIMSVLIRSISRLGEDELL